MGVSFFVCSNNDKLRLPGHFSRHSDEESSPEAEFVRRADRAGRTKRTRPLWSLVKRGGPNEPVPFGPYCTFVANSRYWTRESFSNASLARS